MHQIGLIAETSNDWKVVKVHQDSEIPLTLNVNPILGAEIVGRIKRFEPLMEIIRHQDALYDGTGKPDHLRGEQIPIGARIIKVVKDYNFFFAGRITQDACTQKCARLSASAVRSLLRS